MERKEGEGRNQQKDPSFGAKSKENVGRMRKNAFLCRDESQVIQRLNWG
jgi:hypothetical protein